MRAKISKTAIVTFFMALSMTVKAFAAGEDVSYGFLSGQQKNAARHAQFEEAENLKTDAEREAFFEAQGIGGGKTYSAFERLNAQELVTAGVINQKTADQITAAMSEKHDRIHEKYAAKNDMDPEALHIFYQNLDSDSSEGDSLDELFINGIITQEQADAIMEYLSK